MATKDFKIRHSLTVSQNATIEGNLTLGGKTVSRLIDSDEVTTIVNSNANEVEVFTVTLDSDVGSIGSPSMGDVAFVPYRNVSGRGIQDTSVTIAGGILYANGTYQFAGNAANKGDLEVGDVMIAQTNTAAGDQAWVVTGLGNNADEIIVAALDSDQILEVWVNDLKTNHTNVPITPSVSGTNDPMRASPAPKFYSGWTSVSNVPGSNPAVTTGVTLSGSSGGITHFMPKAYIHDSDGFDIELVVEGTDAYPEHKVMRRQDVFDSDQIVAIINENTTAGSIDSDVTAVAALRRDADSDSIRIQEIATSIEQINELVDSDLKAIADLRNDVDSDSIKLQALEETVEGKDSDFVFSAVKIKASKNYYIQSSQPTITDTGQYWYDTDSDILYKSVPATALTTTIPAGSVNGSPYAGKLINWVANNPSSVTRTDISGTDALGGTFTAGTNADAWFYFTASLSPPNLNGGMYFDFSSDVDIRGIVIEQSVANAGRLAEIKYRNGDYADNNNGGTLTWYNSGGSALGKSVTPNGNTFRDISHPTGELAYRIGFEQIGDYYSGNDVFLFFAGSREWSPVKKGFDSDQIVAIINENTTAGSIDSDVAAVAQLRRDADSDSIRIQEIATELEGINQLVDSDLKAIADLRNDVDSDSIKLQALEETVAGLSSGMTDSDLKVVADLRNDLDSELGASRTTLSISRFDYTATQGQTSFSGADDNGNTLSYISSKIQVFLNGILLLDNTDYTANNNTSLTLTVAADSDDKISIIKYLGADASVSDAINITRFTYKYSVDGNGIVGDSDITGNDEHGNTLSYTAGKIQVYTNGILLEDSDDYIATDGSTITLRAAPDSDDVVSIFKYLGTIQSGFDSEQVVSIVNENSSGVTTGKAIAMAIVFGG